MKHKAFILVPFLMLFSLLSGLISNLAINDFRVKHELVNAKSLDVFSLIEIETVHRIKTQFKTFKPVDFSFETGEWTIIVSFIDETAYLVFEGPERIQATLNYDMVTENIIDYEISSEDAINSD